MPKGINVAPVTLPTLKAPVPKAKAEGEAESIFKTLFLSGAQFQAEIPPAGQPVFRNFLGQEVKPGSRDYVKLFEMLYPKK